MDAELEAWLKAATQDLMRAMADDSVDKLAVLGPVMMDQQPGERLVHEFFIGTCGPEGFRFRLVGCEIRAGARLLLNDVRRELRARRFRIQSFDDPLAMARACEEQWPGANTYELRLDIEHIAGIAVVH